LVFGKHLQGDVLNRFTNHFQVPDNSVDRSIIGGKFFEIVILKVGLNTVDRLKDVV